MYGDRMCGGESWAGRRGNYFNSGPDEGRACAQMSTRVCIHTLTYIRVHTCTLRMGVSMHVTYVSASPRGNVCVGLSERTRDGQLSS